MNKLWLIAIGAAFVVIGGPVAQAHQSRDHCATANQDIAHLEHEKKSTLERIGKGVSSIMPIGLVLHLAKGTEKESVDMATGKYNKRIDMRIAEIKDTCGIK